VKIAIRPSEAEEASPLELDAFVVPYQPTVSAVSGWVRVKATWAATSNSLVSPSAMPF